MKANGEIPTLVPGHVQASVAYGRLQYSSDTETIGARLKTSRQMVYVHLFTSTFSYYPLTIGEEAH